MIINSTDLSAMSKISGETALRYVEANGFETAVLRWKLRISVPADVGTMGAQTTALMYIWNAMNGYDLGKLCREWIAYACPTRPGVILDAVTGETGEPPKPCFSGAAVEEV